MLNENKKYLDLLAEKYPTKQALCKEIINLSAILNLPKGTEHFMSDLHGEYEAFYHILNNCSGVIREKVNILYKDTLSDNERREICTLIYYPAEKLELLHKEAELSDEWYRMILNELVAVAKLLSSKYTRSKVRKAMPEDFAYIIDELLHVQKDEDDNQVQYHRKIIDTILSVDCGDDFIIALAALIKQLAVDHLHIVGDIYDRGPCADRIVDLLMKYHSIDIEWGNHDILWMGAACGSTACIANVIRNNLKYRNITILENGYGISLRPLTIFAEKIYPDMEPMEAALTAITIIMFKLEGQVIMAHPEYEMDKRLHIDKINREKNTIELNGKEYTLKNIPMPTVDPDNPYELTDEEKSVMDGLKKDFVNSRRLNAHISFFYEKGSMYRIYNGNLLYHGCIPLDDNGDFACVTFDNTTYRGKAFMDYSDKIARRAFYGNSEGKRRQSDLDFMWYLWCGDMSPIFGRNMKTFERVFIEDKSTWKEEPNPYYKYHEDVKTCNMILREFRLYSENSHIINGHTPVRTKKGEKPILADGKLIIIDGGFSRSYHETTGIAGYTLIYNSHGMRLKAHQPFESVRKALTENKDIRSDSQMVETETARVMVRDTDNGKKLMDYTSDLEKLLQSYSERE